MSDRLLYSEIERIDSAVAESGLELISAQEHRPRELAVRLTSGFSVELTAYIWALRPGGGGAGVRPDDERRVQMTRPGHADFRSRRGAQTLLLGYDPREDVYAAWNFRRRRYTRDPSGAPVKSPSAQTKEWALDAALRDGLCAYVHQINARDRGGRKTSVEEEVLNLRPDHFGAYLDWLQPPAVFGRQRALRARRRRREATERAVRDARFSKRVLTAYGHRCCFCGFGGSVVEAAHIKPVSDGGPDDLPNGFALCPTHHRLFDKGYICLRAAPGLSIDVNESKMIRDGLARADRERIADGLPQPAATPPGPLAATPAMRFVRRHRRLHA